MSTREQRIEVFNDTQDWINQDQRLTDSVAYSKQHTKVFYEDDYQFERFWNRPAQYLSVLRRFAGGISTDYSIYLDMPRSQQIWNCWRN